MTQPIKPCPFCGHDDVEFCEVEPGSYAIDCPECRCIGPISDASVDMAIMMWNLPLRLSDKARLSVMTERVQQLERQVDWAKHNT